MDLFKGMVSLLNALAILAMMGVFYVIWADLVTDSETKMELFVTHGLMVVSVAVTLLYTGVSYAFLFAGDVTK